MTRAVVALFSLGLVAACGSGAEQLNASTKTEETPVTPTGSVSGQVLTTAMNPLAEADVRLTVGANVRTARTDAAGAFAFAEVPAGSDVLVSVQKAGFATLHTATTVPAAAGQFPLAQGNARVGPVVLAALDGTLQFLVIDGEGRPAAGARARLVASPAGTVFGAESIARVAVDGMVSATGTLSLSGLPSPFELQSIGGGYALWIEPLDRNDDGFADLGGRALEVSARDVVNNEAPRTIVLPPSAPGGDGMWVEAGNAGSFVGRRHPSQNLIAAGEALRLVFNAPIEATSVQVRLTDEFGAEELSVTATVEGAGATLVVSTTRTLVAGAEYNVHVRLASTSGDTYAATGFFFVGEAATPKALGLATIRYQETSAEQPRQLTMGETLYVEFNQVLAKSGRGEPAVEAFFSVDINGDGTVGDTIGELGNAAGRGLPLVRDEPTGPYEAIHNTPVPVFPLAESGYTTRYAFTYPGSVALDPEDLQITVDFDRLRERTADVYETAWGAPATGKLTSGVHGLPPLDAD